MNTLRRILFITCFLCLELQSAIAQMDIQCKGRDLHSLYIVSDTAFYRIDSVDTKPSNPIWVGSTPMQFGGISINANLDSTAGPETMYYVDPNASYFFWNGKSWRSTGHTGGSAGAANPGGSSNYIFNLDGNAGSLYRYNGTGNGTLLLSNLNTNGAAIFDVAVDNKGNFYLFFTNLQKIVAYNPNGIPLDTFTTTGFPGGTDPGFAILGNRMYAIAQGIYEGIRTGKTINFTLVKSLSVTVADIAACPEAGTPLAIFKNPEMPHFAVYPNPAHDYAMLKLDNTVTIEITDCLGRKIMDIDTRGITEYQLSVSGWTSGIYFINARSEYKDLAHGELIVR